MTMKIFQHVNSSLELQKILIFIGTKEITHWLQWLPNCGNINSESLIRSRFRWHSSDECLEVLFMISLKQWMSSEKKLSHYSSHRSLFTHYLLLNTLGEVIIRRGRRVQTYKHFQLQFWMWKSHNLPSSSYLLVFCSQLFSMVLRCWVLWKCCYSRDSMTLDRIQILRHIQTNISNFNAYCSSNLKIILPDPLLIN